MFELLLVAIALIGGFAAGIYDILTTNIPDKICILMIISGISLHILNGFLIDNFTMLLYSLLFGGIFLIFSLLMYYAGQWGGGDGELLIAIGVLLPNLSFSKTYFPFALSFFINSFFIGVIYSVLYSLFIAYRKPDISKGFFKDFKKSKNLIIILPTIFFSILFLLISQFLLSLLFFLMAILLVFEKFAKSIEKGFYKKISVSKLKVDDMIGEDIPRLKIYKRFIRGLKKEDVERIKKIKKYVIIREGIRYGIVFPLALLFTLFFGDLLFLFL